MVTEAPSASNMIQFARKYRYVPANWHCCDIQISSQDTRILEHVYGGLYPKYTLSNIQYSRTYNLWCIYKWHIRSQSCIICDTDYHSGAAEGGGGWFGGPARGWGIWRRNELQRGTTTAAVLGQSYSQEEQDSSARWGYVKCWCDVRAMLLCRASSGAFWIFTCTRAWNQNCGKYPVQSYSS